MLFEDISNIEKNIKPYEKLLEKLGDNVNYLKEGLDVLISFYIEDANPFYWLYSKIILVIGTIFPIEYFPAVLQPIIKFSPIYVVSYGPAKLFVDFSTSMCIEILIIQVIYLVISFMICHLIYNKGVKKLNVNGG